MDETTWKTGYAWILRWVSFFWHSFYRELKKLKECFSALDADGGGSIGIDELQDPLIGLGFAENL